MNEKKMVSLMESLVKWLRMANLVGVLLAVGEYFKFLNLRL